MVLVLRYWRELLIVAGIAVTVLLLAYARHEHNRADEEEALKKAAQSQSKLDVQTGQIADAYRETTRIIIQQQEAKADAVQAIPSDDLPADVRDAWLAGMRGTVSPIDAQRPE